MILRPLKSNLLFKAGGVSWVPILIMSFAGVLFGTAFGGTLDDIDSQPIIEIGKDGGSQGGGASTADARKTVDHSLLSLEELRLAAKNGDPEAQYFLGRDFLHGGVVVKDAAEAARWFELAARKNVPKAQVALGCQYKYGVGVKRDPVMAVKWLRRAVEAGYLKANVELGLMYFEGMGVHREAVEAYVLLDLASPALPLMSDKQRSDSRKALETLQKELSPEQKELAKEQMNELRDRIIFRRMER